MLIPATRYRDCEAALRFLTEVLELTEHAIYRDEAGAIQHAQLRLGSGIFMFGPGEKSDFDRFVTSPGEAGAETTTVYAVIADVAGLYERVKARAAEIVMPLEAQGYGGSSFTVRDAEGHIFTFGDYDPFETPR
ncbi:MAG: VOC family protein [Pseudomonadota bacterium]